MKETNTLIVGASIAGLASAACLQKEKIDLIIIERHDKVAMPWHTHYERLHLHTSKRFSNLPYKKFGKRVPRYPSRQQVIDYLEDYQRQFAITVRLNTEAISIKKAGGQWITETNGESIASNYVIMATGAYSKPKRIHFDGMETFSGRILHSYEYKSGRNFKGQNVLVVGFGNSACEIAIDLYEQQATASMSVRSPVNVVPRDILGIPVLALSILMNRLSPGVADLVSAPLVRLRIGDITKLGLQKMSYGPLREIRKDGNAPVLDIGTIRLIKKGLIK
ncbi:MAG TPA: NAD(P)/FAD-dependent oxidoreductase, partial [Chitinophagaceae bacterium]